MSLNFGYTNPTSSGQFTGGDLEKDLNLDGNKILNLPTPTDDKHPTNKKYVDDELAKKLDKAGDDMTGPLSLGGDRLFDVADPTLATNGANKRYVDNVVSEKLSIRGGTMYADLSMDDSKITDLATPTENSDAATKKYVDDNSVSNPTVKDSGYTTGYLSMRRVNIDGARIYSEVSNLSSITPTFPQPVKLSFSFNNIISTFAFSSGKSGIIWGGFNALSGSVLKATLTTSASATYPFTKIKLMYSNDTSGIFAADGDITDTLSGSFGNGSHIIPVSGQSFTNMRYLILSLVGSDRISRVNIRLDVVLLL